LPSVQELLDQAPLKSLLENVNRSAVVGGIRSVLEEVRGEWQAAAAAGRMPNLGELTDRIVQRVRHHDSTPLQPLLNATGIVLSPALGRAPLPRAAQEALVAFGRDYVNLELDLEQGGTVPRSHAVEPLLTELTGAEAALVVNSYASALLLALAALASGREVLVARSQLGEGDDRERLSDLIPVAGARLREVGATNRVRSEDYRTALSETTGAVLRVSPWNYALQGSSEAPDLAELSALAHGSAVPLIEAYEAGALHNPASNGGPLESTIKERIKSGADLVIARGDLFLSGPPCGIVAGKREFLDSLRQHPLVKAVQADKLTLAALAATLELSRDETLARRELPLWQLLNISTENLRNRAERLAPQMAVCTALKSAEAIPSAAALSESGLPAHALTSWAIALEPADGTAAQLAARLRRGTPPVIVRVESERVLLQMRTIFPRHDLALVSAVQALGGITGVVSDQETSS